MYLFDPDMFDSSDEGRRAELLKILRWGQTDSTEQDSYLLKMFIAYITRILLRNVKELGKLLE